MNHHKFMKSCLPYSLRLNDKRSYRTLLGSINEFRWRAKFKPDVQETLKIHAANQFVKSIQISRFFFYVHIMNFYLIVTKLNHLLIHFYVKIVSLLFSTSCSFREAHIPFVLNVRTCCVHTLCI